MTDIIPVEVTDEQIHEMLRPRSILERQPRAVRLLEKLAKLGELPSPVVRRILGLTGNSMVKDKDGERSLISSLIAENYMTMRLRIFNSRRSNWFMITLKGRAILKECTKK